MQQLTGEILQNPAQANELEWLETNGLGGWSSSTVTGCHTRRYHSLLMAATVPPTERTSLVSKLDETLFLDGTRYELGTNDYGSVMHPNGYQYLKSVKKEFFPEFHYTVQHVMLEKTICMIHSENTVVIRYRCSGDAQMELLPLLSGRGYHSLMHANEQVNKNPEFSDGKFSIRLYDHLPVVSIHVPDSAFVTDPAWFYHFHYAVEHYRGLDDTEDLFSPGHFTVNLKKDQELYLLLTTETHESHEAKDLFNRELIRRKSLLINQPDDPVLVSLLLAADQFIVRRDAELKTVIAGYHWFTDWGRDTMISLPGLCLSTGRFSDAKKILSAFAKSVSMGMLPNRFQDNGEAPEYNNVDGTLWYFIAVYKYLLETGDKEFILEEILPVLKEIIDWHFRCTRYRIHVDEDNLLFAGEPGQQLTWMDARIGNWVVTPRMGKPVEIQALWYNAQLIFALLLELNNQEQDAGLVRLSATKTKSSFRQKFWFAAGGYLFDVIDENGVPDNSLRPNQLFAISLPFTLIEGTKAESLLTKVRTDLYTPVGLRSLPATDPRYIAHYGGDQWHRDSAYHEGTVWSWLLGPYLDAVMKIDPDGLNTAKEIISAFSYHLSEGCLGNVSEIFDADPPFHPRGCIAQAWGVGEILRAIKQYGLSGQQPAEKIIQIRQDHESVIQ